VAAQDLQTKTAQQLAKARTEHQIRVEVEADNQTHLAVKTAAMVAVV
jgi:hypothetical protein